MNTSLDQLAHIATCLSVPNANEVLGGRRVNNNQVADSNANLLGHGTRDPDYYRHYQHHHDSNDCYTTRGRTEDVHPMEHVGRDSMVRSRIVSKAPPESQHIASNTHSMYSHQGVQFEFGTQEGLHSQANETVDYNGDIRMDIDTAMPDPDSLDVVPATVVNDNSPSQQMDVDNTATRIPDDLPARLPSSTSGHSSHPLISVTPGQTHAHLKPSASAVAYVFKSLRFADASLAAHNARRRWPY
ncbi:unnamed protein product [Cutaneotrichosporon oleaginosum]